MRTIPTSFSWERVLPDQKAGFSDKWRVFFSHDRVSRRFCRDFIVINRVPIMNRRVSLIQEAVSLNQQRVSCNKQCGSLMKRRVSFIHRRGSLIEEHVVAIKQAVPFVD
jgi:hypothetical protein